jgi:hypothetical protein
VEFGQFCGGEFFELTFPPLGQKPGSFRRISVISIKKEPMSSLADKEKVRKAVVGEKMQTCEDDEWRQNEEGWKVGYGCLLMRWAA